MDRKDSHAALDGVLADAKSEFGDSHPATIAQLESHLATCHMAVDALFDNTEYVNKRDAAPTPE